MDFSQLDKIEDIALAILGCLVFLGLIAMHYATQPNWDDIEEMQNKKELERFFK